MKLPGSIQERLRVMNPDRCQWLSETDVDTLSDDGIHVKVILNGAASCIRLRLEPDDIQCLCRDFGKCADFALLVVRSDDEFEAHIIEHKATVKLDELPAIHAQLEGAMVRLLAIAGILGIQIRAATTYTAFRRDKISRETSPDPTAMKISVGPIDHRRAHARRSWENGTLRMQAFGREIRHVQVRVNENGHAQIACFPCINGDSTDSQWQFLPIAE